MVSNDRKLIAVIGATGKQGGGVVRALQASGQFKVRALTRAPGKHRDLAEEVVEADLDRPETLKAVFGQKGMNELIYLVGLYSLVSTTLNGFNVPVPEHE
jgi:nucleoside-diphosphate-sugar epimerase